MKLIKTNCNHERFIYGKFYVDIYDNGLYSAWLHHQDYGISTVLFESDKSISYDEFIELVKNNLDEYIIDYSIEYMDEQDADDIVIDMLLSF